MLLLSVFCGAMSRGDADRHGFLGTFARINVTCNGAHVYIKPYAWLDRSAQTAGGTHLEVNYSNFRPAFLWRVAPKSVPSLSSSSSSYLSVAVDAERASITGSELLASGPWVIGRGSERDRNSPNCDAMTENHTAGAGVVEFVSSASCEVGSASPGAMAACTHGWSQCGLDKWGCKYSTTLGFGAGWVPSAQLKLAAVPRGV